MAQMVRNVIEGVDRKMVPSGQYLAVLVDEGHDFALEWFKLVTQMAFHFGPPSYSGPEHHARKREQALRWSAATSSKRVKAFLDIRVGMLTEDIEREKASEERR